MISKALGATITGINSHIVTVEADVSGGLPQFGIVGLPDSSVKESRERVSSALKSCGVNLQGSRITVNLAPGDLKKAGSLFDLPIAIAIMGAMGKLNIPPGYIFAGELSLDGKINPVKGILSIVAEAKSAGIQNCVVPFLNEKEASVVEGINVYPAKSLKEVMTHINGTKLIDCAKAVQNLQKPKASEGLDFADIKGQEQAKRAFMVAAAGQHNILTLGPPGTGKTMMARRLPSIMPPLTFDESVEVTKIFSVRGLNTDSDSLITRRPFRVTHHTISRIALVGGGSPPIPGEISLAHTGILFLDEIAEYPRNVLEALRQPMEDKRIVVSRIASASVAYPANFMLVAASNPCPCGHLGNPEKCRCTDAEISKYMGKISGPLLDRIDIHVEMPPIPYSELNSLEKPVSSAELMKHVLTALEMQEYRFRNEDISFNAHMSAAHIQKFCVLGVSEGAMLETAYKSLSLSARAYHRILKLARTIADCEGAERIGKLHLAEAISYRNLDRRLWER